MDVKRTVDNFDKIMGRIEALTGQEVLVGVPMERTARAGEPITNASLAYIHEFGSPARNIPARPFMRPGVRNAREQIAAAMHEGAKRVMDGEGDGGVSRTLNTVGMLARNSVVRAITEPNPPFVPLRPATIRARLRRTQAGRRKIAQLQKQGTPLTVWAQQLNKFGDMNIMPLLDTLKMRNSITYVVRPARNATRSTFWGYQRDYGQIITRATR
jgi:hypothetical protein